MFYQDNELCECDECGWQDIAANLYMDPHLLCVRCPVCKSLMGVIERTEQGNIPDANIEAENQHGCKFCSHLASCVCDD